MNVKTVNRRQFLSGACMAAGSAIVARGQETKDAAPVGDWQIGCYTRPWDKHDYRVALDGIAEAGYAYAGIMTAKCKKWVLVTVETSQEEAAEIGEEVRKRGLKALSLYAGNFPVEKSVKAGVEGLRKMIDLCVLCGSPHLLLGGTGKAERVTPYYKVVGECCAYAAEKKVALSVKPHGGKNATGAQCRAIIEDVGHANFRLWYDPGNIFYYSEGQIDPVADAAAVDGIVSGMCVKDFSPPKNVHVTPGTGKVDFANVLARLRKGGFSHGPLVVECLSKGDPAHVTAEASKAREFLERLVAST